MDLADENADTKPRLRLELAGQAGGEIIAAEISKRLTSPTRLEQLKGFPTDLIIVFVEFF